MCKLSINIIGVYSQDYRVTVSSIPAGELISVSTYENPMLSNLTLICDVTSATDQTTPAEDAGTISCTAPINGANIIRGRISGIHSMLIVML